MNTITIGVDLAKSVFSVCEVDGGGRLLRRLLRRGILRSMHIADS